MGFEHYKATHNTFEKNAAHDAIVLACEMAQDFRSMWNENFLPLDECTIQMLPFAIQIMIASRTNDN